MGMTLVQTMTAMRDHLNVSVAGLQTIYPAPGKVVLGGKPALVLFAQDLAVTYAGGSQQIWSDHPRGMLLIAPTDTKSAVIAADGLIDAIADAFAPNGRGFTLIGYTPGEMVDRCAFTGAVLGQVIEYGGQHYHGGTLRWDIKRKR